MSDDVDKYFADVAPPMAEIAEALRQMMNELAPEATVHLAWGFPCLKGNERFISIIAHKAHCNVQLFNGNRLAAKWPKRIEGSGKQLRHVKVRGLAQIDDELREIVKAAVTLDATDPEKVK